MNDPRPPNDFGTSDQLVELSGGPHRRFRRRACIALDPDRVPVNPPRTAPCMADGIPGVEQTQRSRSDVGPASGVVQALARTDLDAHSRQPVMIDGPVARLLVPPGR